MNRSKILVSDIKEKLELNINIVNHAINALGKSNEYEPYNLNELRELETLNIFFHFLLKRIERFEKREYLIYEDNHELNVINTLFDLY